VCDDGNRCNGISACVSGVCEQKIAPVTCAAQDRCHVAGSCIEETGVCTNPEKDCDDSNPCTVDECDPAVVGCYHYDVNCDDGKKYTIDTCDMQYGYCHHEVMKTWTDASSGSVLVWQLFGLSGTLKSKVWSYANKYCNENQPGLPGEGWRLPTISELRSIIRGCPNAEASGTCGVIDQCLSYSDCWSESCSGCLQDGGPANGCYWDPYLQGECILYWSSSQVDDEVYDAWAVSFEDGRIGYVGTGSFLGVRCVRDGP